MDVRRLAAEAARCHGVLLPGVLDAHGVTPRQRQLRVASGEWRRLGNGVLVVASAPTTFEMMATAASVALPGAVLSHQSAARVHGCDLPRSDVHLTLPPGGTNRSRIAVVHQAELDRCDVTIRGGFRVTTLERTLVDLGASLGRNELKRCIEDQLVQRATTFTRVELTFQRRAASGRKGIARTRSVLGELDGQPPAESELEAMFERLLCARGIETPTRQVTFEWSPGEHGRVDAWYPGPRLIVELDGRRFHARLAAFERDRRRDQAALVQGLRTVRFTHRQVTDEPRWVADVMAALLHQPAVRADGDA